MSDKAPLLQIENLRVAIEGKEILRGVDLAIDRGQVHALMGRNGSGKSTLAYVCMGHPHYEVLEGRILYDGQDITEMDTDERARLGMFLAFQYPMAIPGVTVSRFMHAALKARADGREVPIREFRQKLEAAMALLGVDRSFTNRYVNDGFSGGEMKRAEILQLAMLQPKFAVLDETDSGLDADAVRLASESIAAIGRDKMGLLIITHHDKLLEHNPPQYTHVMLGGRIVETGGPELAAELHQHGYERIRQRYPEADAENQAMLESESTSHIGA